MSKIEESPSTPSEVYKKAADLIEHHPNFESRRNRSVSVSMTIGQYLVYLRERSSENHTNETEEEAQRMFEQVWDLLE